MGLCISVAGQKQCAQRCDENCPVGFTCAAVGGGDLNFYCVPRFDRLCAPCEKNADCASPGISAALCIQRGSAGAYCGTPCAADSDCPSEYQCKSVTTVEGSAAKQCILPDAATCPCSPSAVATESKTSCTTSKVLASGTTAVCNGTVVCKEAGPAVCMAPPATSETCNGLDDDCDGLTDEAACEDNNQCTQDTCDGAKKVCVHKAVSGSTCDDGNACSDGDVCSDGQCTSVSAKKCDDGSPCTKDGCDAKTGCSHEPDDGAPCDDGKPCTKADVCVGKACLGTTELCDDDPCLTGKCDIKTGDCITIAKEESATCDDGNACTLGEICVKTFCQGAAKNCDDSNPCTIDKCDKANGDCVYTATAGPCNDNDLCTLGDTCTGGVCMGKPFDIATKCSDDNPCTADTCDAKAGCTNLPKSGSCDDGSGCTKGDTCVAGACIGSVISVCSDNLICTDDICAPDGGCLFVINSKPCEDGDVCTVGDTCDSKACKAGAAKVCSDGDICTTDACDQTKGCTFPAIAGCVACKADVDCDDGKACTAEVCNQQTGVCAFTNISGACSDNDPCTNDACVGGACQGVAKVCVDGNPCTDDNCAGGNCVFNANSVPCDDADACTVGDKCAGSACKSGAMKSCDDNNACTQDACDVGTGACGHSNLAKACDDGDACTGSDGCAGGACKGVAKICNDLNPCTNDTCAGGACVFAPNGNACDDGNTCTVGDGCATGACKPGAAKSCDDVNACTTDSCDAVKGCLSTAIAGCIGLPYAQGFGCGAIPDSWTLSAAAASGAPVWAIDATPNLPGFFSPSCSLNFNNGKDFQCAAGQTTVDGMAFSPTFDATATKAGTQMRVQFARAGVWEGGSNGKYDNLDLSVSVDGGKTWSLLGDYDPWPSNAANWNSQIEDLTAFAGKKFSLRLHFGATDCFANDTSGGFVDDLAIRVGPCVDAAGCNDANPCTDDVCDQPSGACAWKANTASCDDGDKCSAGDKCLNKLCMKGVASCDDGNACTDDACGASGSCTHVNNTAACSDGDACTAGDACAAGACKVGPAKNCDDANPCTNDTCVKSTGACAYVNNAAACNDSNSCTTGDACTGGACVGTPTGTCNDGNPCTDDSCSGSCTYTPNSKPCNDNNVCTQLDQCSAGSCKGSNPQGCDDGNACTNDSCSPVAGCQHANNSTSCNDGNACTQGDACSGGSCQGGGSVNCDDGNPCTNDSCNMGCQHNANSNGCDDGNGCTINDYCSGGSCQGGSQKDCSYLNGSCTTGYCSGGGCSTQNKGNGTSCGSNMACQGGSCVPQCTANASKQCSGGNLYWTDSCGNQGSLAQSCSCGCSGGACIANTYNIAPKCNSFSSSAAFSCPGGVIMTICGSVDTNGMVTVKAMKSDGSSFSGSGSDYRVRVFDADTVPLSSQCKDINVTKATSPSGIGTNALVFSTFDSLATCGAKKYYCVTKTGGTDTAFYCSGILKLN